MMRTDIVRPIVFGLSLGFATAALAAETITITMDKVAFAPTAVSARVGDTLEWRNADFVAHTATARDKSFDINVLPNKIGKLVLKKAGKFDYYCRYHPTMTGTITVTE
ncbi:MAG TPA: cupredoxin domain-containing protein [Pseudolabrys sp.]